MRFLSAITLGLLASQARIASALVPYTLSAPLTCSGTADTLHFDYTLSGLADVPNFPQGQTYEASYRVVYAGTTNIVSVPVSAVAAKAGEGRSEIQHNTVTPKDNNGASFIGQTVYSLLGTILHHQQVVGVTTVTGYFEIDAVSAGMNNITCNTATSTPNIALIPLQYSFNGINQIVTNSYDVIVSTYASVTAKINPPTPIYSFDVTPGLNIDSCFYEIDPATGLPVRFRVPFRISNLALPALNEKGFTSLAVSDENGNPVSSWTIDTGLTGTIGQGYRDSADPSILNWIQNYNQGQVFGRLIFDANTPNVTCDNSGKTNILLAVIDYSTFDVTTMQQTYHYIPGAVDNGLNTASQVPPPTNTLVVQQANTTPPPPQAPPAPTAAKAAARQAAAKKACADAAAKAKAAKAAADAAAAAAAAAAAGQDAANPCKLIVPPNPLTAEGLATPYILAAPCTMADTAGFVQATIISPSTGDLFAYQPLVVQAGKKALVAPIVPKLPADAVVGIWFGSNANFQQLDAADPKTLTQANCVNGAMINGKLSIFGQVAACNGANFYATAAIAFFFNKLKIPALGVASDGLPCPTLRDFSVVDQDPQDNLQTQYLLDANGNTAVNSPKNLAAVTGQAAAAKQAPPTVLTNPGDNPLLSRFINPALRCNNWAIPDLSTPGEVSTTAAIGEIFAAFKQGSPVARIPAGDPMTLDGNGNPNLNKLNAYRVALAGQFPVLSLNQASTATFCKNMVGQAGAKRVLNNQNTFTAAAGPMAGQNLFQFLQARFAAAVGPDNLMCGKLVPGLPNPLAGGAVIAAQSAFSIQDAALLSGASTPDNQPMDPFSELGAPVGQSSSGSTFPVAIVAGAIGGVAALLIASIVIFKVVQKRKATGNVMNTTARECKV